MFHFNNNLNDSVFYFKFQSDNQYTQVITFAEVMAILANVRDSQELKSQLFGSGNIIFTDDVRRYLKDLSNPDPNAKWVERTNPTCITVTQPKSMVATAGE